MSRVVRLCVASLVTGAIWLMLTQLATAQSSPSRPGDLNGDGVVNILDIQLEVNVILGVLRDPTMVAHADLNGDGAKNVVDLQLVVNIVLNVPVVTGVDTLTGSPAQLLTIAGAAFDPTAQITVRFTDSTHYTLDVPAVAVTVNQIVVSVPPFIAANGSFGPGVVSVQVIQTSQSETKQSSTVSNFQIRDLPQLSQPVGTVTHDFLSRTVVALQRAQRRLQTTEDISGGQVSTLAQRNTIEDLLGGCISYIGAVEQVMRNQGTVPFVTLPNGQTSNLALAALSASDRLFMALAQQVTPGSNTIDMDKLFADRFSETADGFRRLGQVIGGFGQVAGLLALFAPELVPLELAGNLLWFAGIEVAGSVGLMFDYSAAIIGGG